MKQAIILSLCLLLASCGLEIRDPYYTLAVCEYVPDSLIKAKQGWIMETIRAANNQNGLETHKQSVHIIEDATAAADKIFNVKETCLEYIIDKPAGWDELQILQRNMTTEQKKIFQNLKSKT